MRYGYDAARYSTGLEQGQSKRIVLRYQLGGRGE